MAGIEQDGLGDSGVVAQQRRSRRHVRQRRSKTQDERWFAKHTCRRRNCENYENAITPAMELLKRTAQRVPSLPAFKLAILMAHASEAKAQ
ncbi:hypothetical protein GmHk_13G036893 [Glycine max]|nr:hypothetical protein GmHk_13G036893 [Glycine max]